MSNPAKSLKASIGKGDKKGKKVDSPDLSQSPTHYEPDEPTYKVIDGTDIQALAIKEEDLLKLREEKASSPASIHENKLVRKKNPNYYPTEEVYVAKLVPNKPLKPIDVNGHTGLQFDKYGDCVTHSILGSVEDYLQEIKVQGKPLELPYDPSELTTDHLSTGVYDKKSVPKVNINEDSSTRALVNWQNKIIQRKRTQGYISKLVKRSSEQLVMNQADNARRYNETKTLIDRTLPLVQYGKGYRFDSEFWSQSLLIGQPEDGIFTTLTKSEKGELPPIEFIGKPNTILEELGQKNQQPTHIRYPWDKSKFLQHRITELGPLIKEVAPHHPDFLQLEVVGNKERKAHESNMNKTDEDTWINPDILYKSSVIEDNAFNMKDDTKDRLDMLPDVVQEPIFGPAIIFGGQLARWTGNESENSGIIALESRLNFETKAGKRVSATFEIINTGTTSVYFDWRKIPDSNPFDIVNSKVQRFYFDTRSNVILPGDSLKINFVFKSQKGGVFTEKWEFLTQPKLLSGASLILTLRGIAVQEDKFRKDRAFIEQNLLDREAEMIAKNMIELILAGVRTPERPASPVDAYLTDEQIFSNYNPGFYYDHDAVEQLKQLYGELYSENERIYNRWNLSLDSFKQELMDLPENDEKKQDLLQRLNTAIYSLTFSSNNPNESKMYNICYNILCQTIDDAVIEINTLKNHLRIHPMVNEDVYPTIDKFSQEYDEWRKEFEVFRQIEAERRNRQEKEKGKDKGKKGGAAADKKDDKKKDEKKKPTPTPNPKNAKTVSKSPQRLSAEKLEEKSVSFQPISEEQKSLRKLYIEKIHTNVYQLLVRNFDYMEILFQQLNENNDMNEKLAKVMNQQTYIAPRFSDYID